MGNVRQRPQPDMKVRISISIDLSPVQTEAFTDELRMMGAQDIETVIRTKREIALMIGVMLPWALNPVLAKFLLLHGMGTLPLITIRLLVFCIFTSVFFVVWKMLTQSAFKPIPHLFQLAGFPILGNAANTLFTYLALLTMPPSVHLTLLRFNTYLLPILSKKKKGYRTLAFFCFFILSAILLFLLTLGHTYSLGILLSVGTLFSYTFYSLATERTLHAHKIDMRYPYLLFQMGLILGILGIILIPFQSFQTLWNAQTLPAIGYVLACVCIPHACYSALLKTTHFKSFNDLLIIEIPLAIVFEIAFLGIVLPPLAYATIGLILGLLLLTRWERLSLPLE
jgi:drug/metabolite transporter (DMT)-like permease